MVGQHCNLGRTARDARVLHRADGQHRKLARSCCDRAQRQLRLGPATTGDYMVVAQHGFIDVRADSQAGPVRWPAAPPRRNVVQLRQPHSAFEGSDGQPACLPPAAPGVAEDVRGDSASRYAHSAPCRCQRESGRSAQRADCQGATNGGPQQPRGDVGLPRAHCRQAPPAPESPA